MPPEKIKIKKSEIDDLYDIEDDVKEEKEEEKTSNAEVSFEEYSTIKDKEDDKKWRSEEGVE